MTSNADDASEATGRNAAGLSAGRSARIGARHRRGAQRGVAWYRSVVLDGLDASTGMLEHLGGAEWHWFQGVAERQAARAAQATSMRISRSYDPTSVSVHDGCVPGRGPGFLTGDQCAESESVLAATPLSAPPRGGRTGRYANRQTFAGSCCMMIEETARHAGHLDLARELLDGKLVRRWPVDAATQCRSLLAECPQNLDEHAHKISSPHLRDH